MPNPKPRWLLGDRPTSKDSGSSNSSGSWLAEATNNMAKSPFCRVTPPTSMSSRKERPVSWTGDTKRSISSTPERTTSGSVRKRWNWSGCSRRASVPPAMRFTVVSCPATSNRMHVDKSSASFSTLPSSSTWTSRLNRSSPGPLRRSASSSKK